MSYLCRRQALGKLVPLQKTETNIGNNTKAYTGTETSQKRENFTVLRSMNDKAKRNTNAILGPNPQASSKLGPKLMKELNPQRAQNKDTTDKEA